MLLKRTVPPIGIVGLQDARDHLRVTGPDEDGYILSLVSAASAMVEDMTGRAIMPQTWKVSFPSVSDAVYLPKTPVQAVTAIEYFDSANTVQTAQVSDFDLFADEDRAWLEPKPGKVWPSAYDRPDGVSITFTAGYSVVPESLRHAVLLTVGQWFDNRSAGGDMGEMPFAVSHLVGLHRVGWIGA